MSEIILDLKHKDVRMYRPKQLPYHFVLFYDLPVAGRVMYMDAMNGSPEDNALLTYCYIDTECGMSFFSVCSARLHDNGHVEFNYSGSIPTFLTIRESGLISSAEIIDEDCPGMERFLKEAEFIKDNYGYFKDRVEIHDDIPFDAFRHPAAQEHIMTYFLSKNLDKEIIWTSEVSRIKDSFVEVYLLDEPYNSSMEVHKGERIIIGPFDPGVGEIVPTAMLSWMVDGNDD